VKVYRCKDCHDELFDILENNGTVTGQCRNINCDDWYMSPRQIIFKEYKDHFVCYIFINPYRPSVARLCDTKPGQTINDFNSEMHPWEWAQFCKIKAPSYGGDNEPRDGKFFDVSFALLKTLIDKDVFHKIKLHQRRLKYSLKTKAITPTRRS